MNSTERLIEILSAYGFPVRHQAYLLTASASDLPNTFWVYYERDTADAEVYDNLPASIKITYTIYLYSKDSTLLYDTFKTLKFKLLAEGYYMEGIGTQTSAINGYVGRYANINIKERLN
jgi:hypothetical protein